MLAPFLLSIAMGCWEWGLLIPCRLCDPIPSPSKMTAAIRHVATIDLISLTLLFAIYRAGALAAVVAWLVVRFAGVYCLYRHGWYWLADWIRR